MHGATYHVQHKPPNAEKLIVHAEKNIQQWIDNSDNLSGSVAALIDSEASQFLVCFSSDEESDEDSADDDVDFDFTAFNGTDGSDSNSSDEDAEEDAEEKKAPQFWVQCDNKTCRKWRLLETTWTRKRFTCVSVASTCNVECDGCDDDPCSCVCERCRQLFRVNPHGTKTCIKL